MISIGINNTGSGLHRHDQNWVAQMVGRKVWLLVPFSLPFSFRDPVGRHSADLT